MAAVAQEHPRVRRWNRLRIKQAVEGWLFIGPVMLGVLFFQFYPILVSMYASLTNWTGLTPPEFIGVDNYVRLLTRDRFFTLSHDKDQAENLERRNERRNCEKEQCGRQQRDRHMTKATPGACPVDLGCFVELLGDTL